MGEGFSVDLAALGTLQHGLADVHATLHGRGLFNSSTGGGQLEDLALGADALSVGPAAAAHADLCERAHYLLGALLADTDGMAKALGDTRDTYQRVEDQVTGQLTEVWHELTGSGGSGGGA